MRVQGGKQQGTDPELNKYTVEAEFNVCLVCVYASCIVLCSLNLISQPYAGRLGLEQPDSLVPGPSKAETLSAVQYSTVRPICRQPLSMRVWK